MVKLFMNNRRQKVDEIVKNLSRGKEEIPEITASLMRSFQVLENNSHYERDAFQDILAANVLLSKAVGQLVTDVARLKREVEVLRSRR